MTDDVPAGDAEVMRVIDSIKPTTFYHQREIGGLVGWCARTRDALRASLASETERADKAERERDEARAVIQEDGETIAQQVTRAEAAEASLLACQAENAKLVEALEEARVWIELAEDYGRDTTKALALVDTALATIRAQEG